MADTYYVRSRGRISGPFDVDALRKLVRRSILSRAHEISSDRRAWTSAGAFEELFPAADRDYAEPAAPVAVVPAPVAVAAQSEFFYAQNGETVGPVPLSVLKSLVRNGTLGRDDVVWGVGAETANAAARIPALAAMFAGGGRTLDYDDRQRRRTGPTTEADRSGAARVMSTRRAVSQVAGIVTGVAMLVLLNLPIGTVKDHVIWWWDALSQPKVGSAGVVLFFVLFSGIAAGLVGGLVRGLARGWVFVGISAVSFALFLVLGLYQASADAGFVFCLAVPYLATCLIGVSWFRGDFPEHRGGQIFQAVVGGLLAFTTLILGAVGLVQDAHLKGGPYGSEMPAWAVFGLTVGVLGTAAAIAAGVLGLVGMKQKFSPAANWAAVGCAGAAVLLPCFAVMIVAGGLSAELTDQSGLFIFTCFRVIAIFVLYLVLGGFGLTEVLVASHAGVLTKAVRG